MKKFKLIIINTILIVLLVELSSFIFILCKNKEFLSNYYHQNSIKRTIALLGRAENYNDTLFKRTPFIKNNDKPHTIIFGCSFGYGNELKDEETIAGHLSNYGDISVHNFSLPGAGPQMMLWRLNQPDFKENINNADTIIYVYAVDPVPRSCKFRCHPFSTIAYYRYKENKNGFLTLQIPSPLTMYSYFFRIIEGNFEPFFNKKNQEQMFLKIMEESYKKTRELYPNSKFIILYYESYMYYKLSNELISKLNDIGIQVISSKDLTTENLDTIEYQISQYDAHPNSKAWGAITPQLLNTIKN